MDNTKKKVKVRDIQEKIAIIFVAICCNIFLYSVVASIYRVLILK